MFSEITETMLANLDSFNRERFDYIQATIESGELTPPLVVRRFSDLAFSLARKSLRIGSGIEIAGPLGRTFEQYLNSDQISAEAKAKHGALISDTKLDFLFASGEHDIASLRLAPYISARKNK